jgi:hypothetical protein
MVIGKWLMENSKWEMVNRKWLIENGCYENWSNNQ